MFFILINYVLILQIFFLILVHLTLFFLCPFILKILSYFIIKTIKVIILTFSCSFLYSSIFSSGLGILYYLFRQLHSIQSSLLFYQTNNHAKTLWCLNMCLNTAHRINKNKTSPYYASFCLHYYSAINK